VIARYGDGAAAAVARRLGNGQAALLGAQICDIFVQNRRGEREADPGRFRWLGHVAQAAGANDQAWVWKVNLENLERVTGRVSVETPPPDESIQFRSYMYEHSCLHIVPWLTEGQWSSNDDRGQNHEHAADVLLQEGKQQCR
jgi:hypothetical protein